MKEEQNFEDSWKQFFEEAALKPPDRVWENIERELDRKRRRPFLLLWVRPQVLVGSIAALLLLVWGGISFFQRPTTTNNSSKIVLENKPQPTNEININAQKIAKIEEKPSENKIDEKSSKQNNILKNNESLIAQYIAPKRTNDNNINIGNEINRISNQSENQQVLSLNNNNFIRQNNDNQVVINKNEDALTTKNENRTLAHNELKTLNTRGFYTYGNRFTMNRNKLLVDFDLPETKENLASNESKFYLGVQSGAAPFNPNIQLQSVSTVALAAAQTYAQSTANNGTGNNNTHTTTVVKVGTPQNDIKAGFSSNYGVSFGYQLSKNWGLESGLRYLQGSSTLSSNSYAVDAITGSQSTYLAQYLASKSAVVVAADAPNTIIADVGSLNNNYQYLSVPLQASYTLLPKNRLNFSILGGIAADIFLKNVISDNNNLVTETTFTPSNNIYKPLNISGLGGLRGNYTVDKHWQAVLGGSYQQALSSGFQSVTNLQMKMQLWGVQAGLNYRF